MSYAPEQLEQDRIALEEVMDEVYKVLKKAFIIADRSHLKIVTPWFEYHSVPKLNKMTRDQAIEYIKKHDNLAHDEILQLRDVLNGDTEEFPYNDWNESWKPA